MGAATTPSPTTATAYQGAYQDSHGTPEEPHVGAIRELAANGLTKLGHHGPMTAMGVPAIASRRGTTSRS